MIGDYQNVYQGKLLKAVFLAELHGILCLTNFNNRNEANSLETVKYWENAVQNLQYFNDLMDNKPNSLNTFLSEIENVYVHQYIDNIIKAAKICYQNGKVNQSIELLQKGSQIVDQLFDIIAKQQGQPIEDEKYFDYYISELNKFSAQAKIMLMKLFVLTKQMQKAKQSLEQAQNSVKSGSSNMNTLFLIYKFDLLYSQECNESDLEKIEEEIENSIKLLEKNDDNSEIFGEYYQFRLKYNLDNDNEKQQIDQYNQLNKTQLIELQNHSIDLLIAESQYEEALGLVDKQFNLIENNHNSMHYLYEQTMALKYFLMIKLGKYELFHSQIANQRNQIYNVGNLDFSNIIEFYENIFQICNAEQGNHLATHEILEKVEKLQFQNPHITFLKYKSLEICYLKLRLQDKLRACLQFQLDYLKNMYLNGSALIVEIENKISKVNC